VTTNDWRHHAACRDEDPELFFPLGDNDAAHLQAEQAKRVCLRCPVIEWCAQWAIDNRMENGVWGGLDETQLRNIHRHRTPSRRREPARCGTRPGYKRHLREHTGICEPCAEANRTYMNRRNQTLKEAA
jgi:WhiB family redox-sensing transcriptional regulator